MQLALLMGRYQVLRPLGAGGWARFFWPVTRGRVVTRAARLVVPAGLRPGLYPAGTG